MPNPTNILAQKTASELVQLTNKNSLAWIIMIFLAILVDFSGFFLLGSFLSIFLTLTLWQFSRELNITGPFLVTRIRIIFWALSFFEMIPVINIVPAWTIGMLWIHHKVKKQAALAESQLKALENVKPSDQELSDEYDYAEAA